MNPITHLFIGWCTACIDPRLDDRERTLVTLAAVVPDIDGLGLIPEVLTRDTPRAVFWYSDYHHVLAHNLLAAVIAAALVAIISRRAALLAFVAYHTHLVCDLVGARGPDGYVWPIPYAPHWTWSWDGAWALNAWQNVVITMISIVIAITVAIRRGYSPVRIFSRRADALIVTALRRDALRRGATSGE
jgi:inner membrane protein